MHLKEEKRQMQTKTDMKDHEYKKESTNIVH